jgi:DNA invertase Pin-like site-specific DNA recombinase
MADILGYARVSTDTQELDSQKIRLRESGAIKICEDVISGKIFKRPGLDELIAYARKGDILCVVRLDRLGRSLKELLETVEFLKSRNIGLIP